MHETVDEASNCFSVGTSAVVTMVDDIATDDISTDDGALLDFTVAGVTLPLPFLLLVYVKAFSWNVEVRLMRTMEGATESIRPMR